MSTVHPIEERPGKHRTAKLETRFIARYNGKHFEWWTVAVRDAGMSVCIVHVLESSHGDKGNWERRRFTREKDPSRPTLGEAHAEAVLWWRRAADSAKKALENEVRTREQALESTLDSLYKATNEFHRMYPALTLP